MQLHRLHSILSVLLMFHAATRDEEQHQHQVVF